MVLLKYIKDSFGCLISKDIGDSHIIFINIFDFLVRKVNFMSAKYHKIMLSHLDFIHKFEAKIDKKMSLKNLVFFFYYEFVSVRQMFVR